MFRSKVGMGRRKIEIKKLENVRNRNATFKKRRQGILKKAHELAVLTDSKVTLSIKNGDALENHVFNDQLQAVPSATLPFTVSSPEAGTRNEAETPGLDEGVVQEVVHVPTQSEQTPGWPSGEMDLDYSFGLDSLFEPPALDVSRQICANDPSLDISMSTLGIFDYLPFQDSYDDPFLSLANQNDSNWLAPWLVANQNFVGPAVV